MTELAAFADCEWPAFSPDGDTLLVVHSSPNKKRLRLIDTKTWKVRADFPWVKGDHWSRSPPVVPDTRNIAILHADYRKKRSWLDEWFGKLFRISNRTKDLYFAEIKFIDVDRGIVSSTSTIEAPGSDSAIAPDGRSFVFRRYGKGYEDLVEVWDISPWSALFAIIFGGWLVVHRLRQEKGGRA